MVAYLVTCEPVTNGGPAVAPCGVIGGVNYAMVVKHGDEGPPDFSNADQLFAYGMLPVILFWGIGKCVGAILSAIRNG